MDVAVDRGGWVGAEGADRAGGGGCVESVGGEGGLEGGVGERVGRNGARVSKDEGLMDSGEWLEELRSGFGSQVMCVLIPTPTQTLTLKAWLLTYI